MRALLAAVLSVATLAGCHDPRMHYRAYVSADFSPAERAAVVAGLEQWERASGGAVAVDAVEGPPDGGEDAIVVDLVDEDGRDGHAFPLAPGNRAHVTISRQALSREDLGGLAYVSRVAAHEVGHVLGLDHVEDEDSIMRVEGPRDESWRVTCRDVRAACAHREAECGCAE